MGGRSSATTPLFHFICCRPHPAPKPRPPPPPRWREPLLGAVVAGALSLGLAVCPPALVLGAPPVAAELCREEAPPEVGSGAGEVTNEAIVEEAWEVVNESFLDAGRHGWSREKWLQKRSDIFSGKIQSRSKAHDVIRRMLGSLQDPYTRFLSPPEFSKMARYDITGIGINLREIPDESGATKLKVLGIIHDGPAYAAGVRQGDELLSVNGVDVKGQSAFEVSSLLQGPTETFVTIQVKHEKCDSIQVMDIQRKLAAHTPVFYRLEKADNGTKSIGYIHLKEFNALAKKDLVIAMKRLQDSGASYFILDLRDNLGGLVQAGIEIAKLFLDKGDTVISTVGRDPQVQNKIISEKSPTYTSPLVVLVNNRTASASEIVSAALHDNCKSVLVGDRTYGKGLIQSVYELHDGSGIVVTIGKYVTPKHQDINQNGIDPDFSQIPDIDKVKKHLQQCQMERKQQQGRSRS